MEGLYLTQDEIQKGNLTVELATESRPYLYNLEYRVPLIEKLMYLAGMHTMNINGHEGDVDRMIPTAFGFAGINTAVASTFTISPAKSFEVESQEDPNMAPSLRRIAQWYDTSISLNRRALSDRIERRGLKPRNPNAWASAVDYHLKLAIWGNLYNNTVRSAMPQEAMLVIAELGTAAMFLAESAQHNFSNLADYVFMYGIGFPVSGNYLAQARFKQLKQINPELKRPRISLFAGLPQDHLITGTAMLVTNNLARVRRGN